LTAKTLKRQAFFGGIASNFYKQLPGHEKNLQIIRHRIHHAGIQYHETDGLLRVDADQGMYVDVLSSRDRGRMERLVSGYDLVFIDEAQRIPDIGINLKILHDQFTDLQVIATGSSSFELGNRISEPLTGRTWTYNLFPIAVSEWRHSHNLFELDVRLEEFLQFGMYPEVFSLRNAADKMEYLMNLSRAYLYKDVLELEDIRHAGKIKDLLRLLAYQTGSLVSFSELATNLGLSTPTVQRYVDLLEKAFVIFRLTGYSRNLRKEIVKNPKIYFLDLGVRNAVLENFNPPEKRQDIGALWENFLLLERMKTMTYQRRFANRFFWRTYTGAELDYVEESSGELAGYEFKWGRKTGKVPATWLDTYREASYQCVNRENYLEFLAPPVVSA
jgi:predicted AAA+ superfamily ATPase